VNDKTKQRRSGLEDNGVGRLRQQSALCDSERRVVLVSSDPEVLKILHTLQVEHFFPDTTNEHGSFDEPTFKIRIEKK
jgi:hypothetical protein